MKSIKIGKWISNSDCRLPGKIEIIFLWSLIIWLISILAFSSFSNKGCPVKVDWIFSFSKYFFSNGNNNKTWSRKDLNFLTLPSLQTHTWGATKWIVFIFGLIFLTFSATLNVKSGLSTLNKISGLNSIILFTVSSIFFFYFKYV